MPTKLHKFTAEFVGTFFFVLVAAGVICTDQALRTAGQSGIGLLGIALATGLALAAVMSAIGHISGGHVNPAVTIGFWVTRRMGTFEALGYWISQLLGGMFAAYILSRILPDSIWGPVSLGTPDLAAEFTRMHGMELEFLLTFFLVFVFFGVSTDAKSPANKVAGIAVGLAFAAGILLGGPFTGACMNPARLFGPALLSRHWTNDGVYWAGPLLGGVFAGWIFDRLYLRKP